MVTVDQMMIKDIPSSAVPYVLPICYEHHLPYVIYYTRRVENQELQTLTVKRKYHCLACKAEGKHTTQSSTDTRRFGKNSISKHFH